jgi:hypothetical protein
MTRRESPDAAAHDVRYNQGIAGGDPAERSDDMRGLWKVSPGIYETPGGRFRIERDVTGPVSKAEREGTGVMAGCDDDGWALVEVATEQVIDWFPTAKAAVAESMAKGW